jgi:rsbT antagonist protein RsbS
MQLRGMHLTSLGGGSVLLEPSEALDPGVPDELAVPLADAMQQMRARQLLYDLKSQSVIDGLYYAWLCRVAAICRISGVEMVAVNMRPAAAYALAVLMEGPPPFRCALDVDRARASPP